MAGSAFFTLLSVIMVCVTYEPESFMVVPEGLRT